MMVLLIEVKLCRAWTMLNMHVIEILATVEWSKDGSEIPIKLKHGSRVDATLIRASL